MVILNPFLGYNGFNQEMIHSRPLIGSQEVCMVVALIAILRLQTSSLSPAPMICQSMFGSTMVTDGHSLTSMLQSALTSVWVSRESSVTGVPKICFLLPWVSIQGQAILWWLTVKDSSEYFSWLTKTHSLLPLTNFQEARMFKQRRLWTFQPFPTPLEFKPMRTHLTTL